MSMRFEIDFDRSPTYVYILTDGEASVNGFDELLTAIVSAPQWTIGTKQLVDHRKLILQKLTADDMRAIKDVVKKISTKLGNGRCAFVVNDTLGFGLARMYELLGGNDIHQEIAVFYTIDEAVEWLGN
jgi:hypothetical protein